MPDTCVFEFEVRNVPGHDPQRAAGDGWTSRPAARPTWSHVWPAPGAEGEGGTGRFGTEAGIWRPALGIPAVVCGPGDIADAHRADESVELEQLERCLAQLGALAG